MHCHSGTNNRVPRWTFTDPCKPEVRPGAREQSASPVWLAAPAINARDTTKVYIGRLDTGCGPTLYRKCHSHNTPASKSLFSSSHRFMSMHPRIAFNICSTRISFNICNIRVPFLFVSQSLCTCITESHSTFVASESLFPSSQTTSFVL